MPELPEVEVLVRHLQECALNKQIQSVVVRRPRVIRPNTEKEISKALIGRSFTGITRRAKCLVFEVSSPSPRKVLGHLGMTGRMYLQAMVRTIPKHAAVVLGLGDESFIFEDTRGFGRFTLDTSCLEGLGPEPLGQDFTVDYLANALQTSTQSIKVKLLDQRLVAGIGNIYASEALFRAGISPKRQCCRVRKGEISKVVSSICEVLRRAVEFGGSVPLNWDGGVVTDKLFYYGTASEDREEFDERFAVYDRAGESCIKCGTLIKRIIQAQRSTFYCSKCQR